MGAPQCLMSILRNGNVACPCRLFSPNVTCQILGKAMSHVTLNFSPCPMSLSPMSHVHVAMSMLRVKGPYIE